MEGVGEGEMKENVRGRRDSCGEIKNSGRVGGSYNNGVNNNYSNSNNYANNNSYNYVTNNNPKPPTPPTPLNPKHQSPNTISLSTPSTLRRRPNN